MDEELKLAVALAHALMEGKTAEELARLQILLQTVTSLVSAEVGCRRLGASTPLPTGGARQ